MNSGYVFDSEFGISNTHYWFLHASLRRGFWRVASSQQFCRSGYAVVDDFGNLVEVRS